MKPDYENVTDAALKLDAPDRCRVAGMLWDSIGAQIVELDDLELEKTLNEREAELDADPSKEMSHDEFMSSFAGRRCS